MIQDLIWKFKIQHPLFKPMSELFWYLAALDKEVLKEFSGLKFSFTKNINFGLEVSLFFNKLFARTLSKNNKNMS